MTNQSTHPPAPLPQPPGIWAPPQPIDDRVQYGPPPSDQQSSPSRAQFPAIGLPAGRAFNAEDVEHSKMVRSRQYSHMDETLQNERQRCRRALARFNEACKLENAVSPDQIREFLWIVLDPSRDTLHKFRSQIHEKGSVSYGVMIEAPFTCTYGYNINIMDSVWIGEGCTIDDAAKVEIGPRCSIGPQVTIFTSDVDPELINHKGTESAWRARPVIIGAEVIVGRGVTICPGVILRKGEVVPAYTVLRE
jgi:acetyltransferase-like isoleucine patch superfamily enzyme